MRKIRIMLKNKLTTKLEVEAMNNSTIKNEDGYLARNRWMIYLIVAFAILASLQVLKDMDMGFQFPDYLTYMLVTALSLCAGVYNAFSGTTTAKIFRWVVVFGLIAAAIWYVVDRI